MAIILSSQNSSFENSFMFCLRFFTFIFYSSCNLIISEIVDTFIIFIFDIAIY